MPEEMANHESDRPEASLPGDSGVEANGMPPETVSTTEPEAVQDEVAAEATDATADVGASRSGTTGAGRGR